MTRAGAETAITGSALVVGGIYVYRRLSEGEGKVSGSRTRQLAGVGPVLPVGPFVVGWGFTFLALSLLAQASPQLGGYMAVLVATGAVLGNGEAVTRDLSKQLGSRGGTAANAGAVALPSSGETAPAEPVYPAVFVLPPNFQSGR